MSHTHVWSHGSPRNDHSSAQESHEAPGVIDGPKMKAVVWDGHVGHMEVRHVPMPKITRDSQVLVRITTAAICGSDLHTLHGLFGGNDIPYSVGHEAVGVVSAVGKSVHDYKPGDRVIVLGGEGFDTLKAPEFFGVGDLMGHVEPGLQAEYALVPDTGTLLHIPPGYEKELDYVLISDIFCTGWHSIDQSGFIPGDVVAVYGAGPMGLMAAYSAILRGASKVYSIDRVDQRLEKAKSIGAIPIDLRRGLPSKQILVHEPTGVPRVCDCSGFESVNVEGKPDESFILNDAIALVQPEGGIAITGAYWAAKPDRGEPRQSLARGRIPFDISAWWIKDVSIRGGAVDLTIAPRLLALIESGRAKPSFVFDHREFSIDEAPEAYRLFSERKIDKPAIRFFP